MKINSFTTNSQQINANGDKAKTAGEKALQNISAARALSGADSSNLAIADALLSQSNILEQGITNANDAIGMLGIADSTLANLSQSADRLNELSVRSNSAALNDTQRSMLNSEANALKDSMNQSLQDATFNGKNVFGAEMNFFTGSATQEINLNSETIGAGISSLDISNPSTIDEFTKNINSLRGDIGAAQNGMLSDISNTLRQGVSLRQSESNLQNNDIAKNLNDINSSNLQLNAALLAQAHNTQALAAQMDRLLA
ncbi:MULTISPECIES: flagellin [unclassified Campylobacter]|uniref:flagellin n=1 Tax=unclassified Campylobacter TaxID=2593542 RepID=UPI003D33819E